MSIDYQMLTPKQLVKGYSDGSIQGSIRNPEGLARFLAESNTPHFGSWAWELHGTGKGKTRVLTDIIRKYIPTFGEDENQHTGDCVSHGVANAGTANYCVKVALNQVEFKGRFAKENIYGMRGHAGQGASCSTLARYVSPEGVGGFLIRDKYSSGRNSVDLSVYNGKIGHDWGRRGTPEWLNDIAAKSKAHTVAMVTDIEEVADCNVNGYGVVVCSDKGFPDKRGKFGVCDIQGTWYHAMAVLGYIWDENDPAYKYYGGPLFLIVNSWAIWNRGPIYLNQPGGSFWVTWKTLRSMLRRRGSFMVADVHRPERRVEALDYLMLSA